VFVDNRKEKKIRTRGEEEKEEKRKKKPYIPTQTSQICLFA
jgi:hypothetical protein